MRNPEDPCRDPASEARDDHASEPRVTPETDAAQTMWNDIGMMVVLSSFSRRLERQRDELLEAIRRLAADFECEGDEFRAESWRNFIAAVKGGRDE
jgi:hypothetical protein